MRRPRVRSCSRALGRLRGPRPPPLGVAARSSLTEKRKCFTKSAALEDEKSPWWSAERRAGERHSPAVLPLKDRPDRKTGHGVRRSAPAPFGASPPSCFRGERNEG